MRILDAMPVMLAAGKLFRLDLDLTEVDANIVQFSVARQAWPEGIVIRKASLIKPDGGIAVSVGNIEGGQIPGFRGHGILATNDIRAEAIDLDADTGLEKPTVFDRGIWAIEIIPAIALTTSISVDWYPVP